MSESEDEIDVHDKDYELTQGDEVEKQSHFSISKAPRALFRDNMVPIA